MDWLGLVSPRHRVDAASLLAAAEAGEEASALTVSMLSRGGDALFARLVPLALDGFPGQPGEGNG